MHPSVLEVYFFCSGMQQANVFTDPYVRSEAVLFIYELDIDAHTAALMMLEEEEEQRSLLGAYDAFGGFGEHPMGGYAGGSSMSLPALTRQDGGRVSPNNNQEEAHELESQACALEILSSSSSSMLLPSMHTEAALEGGVADRPPLSDAGKASAQRVEFGCEGGNAFELGSMEEKGRAREEKQAVKISMEAGEEDSGPARQEEHEKPNLAAAQEKESCPSNAKPGTPFVTRDRHSSSGKTDFSGDVHAASPALQMQAPLLSWNYGAANSDASNFVVTANGGNPCMPARAGAISLGLLARILPLPSYARNSTHSLPLYCDSSAFLKKCHATS